jgi:hypothetical protein
MMTKPAKEPFPSAPFAEDVRTIADKVPILFRRHLKAIAEAHSPKPETFEKSPFAWSRSRDRLIDAALERHAAGSIEEIRINSGRPIEVEGPFHCSRDSAFDPAKIAERLKPREIDNGELGKPERIYYALSGPLAVNRTADELLDFIHCMSFAETKAFDRFTGIYFYLLRNEPKIAESYSYSARTEAPQVRYDDILRDYRRALGRHWVPSNPETASCILIERDSRPVRILSFVRPIPAEAILRINERFDEAGQDYEHW